MVPPMARPYQRIGRLETEQIVDEGDGELTTWDLVKAVRVPMAPGVDMPLSLNRSIEYRMIHTDTGWVLEGRSGRRNVEGATES